MWTSSHASSPRPRSSQPIVLSAGLLGLSTLLSISAWPAVSAAGPCSGVPNPVVVSGSPAAEALVQAVGRVLQINDPKPLTIVWKLDSSCGGVESVALDSLPGSCAPGACITGKAKFWTLDSRDTAPKTCDLDAAGTHVDLALSDVFPQTCPAFSGAKPAGILDTTGPITPYAVVMAKSGPEAAIQAEEAHFVFGAGKAAGVKPWLNDATIFLLGDKDAGQLILGPRVKLAVGKWHGKLVTSSDDIFSGLQNDPATAIGILPTTIADSHRATDARVMAFQAIGQHGAFYPDRRSTTFEKQNVRDGHYPLWGYLHMILRADPVQPTMPKSANGARVASILLAQSQVGGQDVLPMQVAAGFVPQCAMHIARTDDVSAPSVYAPPDPCHCWFEKNVPNGMPSCAACPDGKTCAIGKCRRNFCEVQ